MTSCGRMILSRAVPQTSAHLGARLNLQPRIEADSDSNSERIPDLSELPPYLRCCPTPTSCCSSSDPPPIVKKSLPRLWANNPCVSLDTRTATTASMVGKRARPHTDWYNSDDEDEDDAYASGSSDEEDGDRISRSSGSPARKSRRLCSPGRRRFHKDRKAASRKPSLVKFAEPLISAVHSRPRTSPRDKANLFYNSADQARFREEYRREVRERKSRALNQDEDDFSNDDEENKTDAVATIPSSRGASVHSDELPTTDMDNNEVSESSSSNDEDESDGESSDESLSGSSCHSDEEDSCQDED
uniref:Uncharacterized protein n=1 Tax=Odontella aurita TaxID=265563 RepID=A0A6U6G569_9STRA|mmetsp:Transcript_40073/g.120803  ORF Transcript_40073/g.120803 Transcript_40073/m.120803 type:complete len:302 (+) Transcript_40073:149-1054(+)